MRSFNGTVHMLDCRPATPVSIDSCKKAAGAFFHGDFIHTQWFSVYMKRLIIHEPIYVEWSLL